MEYLLEKPIKQDEILGGAIYIYKNIFKDTDNLIAKIEKEASNVDSGLFYDKAITMGGDWSGPRKNLLMPLTECAKRGNELAREIHNRFGFALDRALTSYSKDFETYYTWHESYSLLKYRGENKEHYDAHYDGNTQGGRWISAVLYLNDDYLGGEIEFPHFDVKIKPEAGTLVLFPSNYAYRHIAHEVTSGIKYALVTWIHDT
jgi:hypothetical protein